MLDYSSTEGTFRQNSYYLVYLKYLRLSNKIFFYSLYFPLIIIFSLFILRIFLFLFLSFDIVRTNSFSILVSIRYFRMIFLPSLFFFEIYFLEEKDLRIILSFVAFLALHRALR